MFLLTDEAAGAALEEVGRLQQAIDAGEVDLDSAGDMIIERLDAVMDLYSDSSTVYATLVEPFMSWAIHSLGPKFIVDQDSTPESRQYKALYARFKDFYAQWKHLDPAHSAE